MKDIYEIKDQLDQIVDLLENHLGTTCEIVLHDNLKDYDKTIIDIRNGHITGRSIGDGGDKWGLEVLRGERNETHKYNKVMRTNNNRYIKNSSTFFRNEEGDIVGSLCLNYDLTSFLDAQKAMGSLIGVTPLDLEKSEQFLDVAQLLDQLIASIELKYDQPLHELHKNEKTKIVKLLDEKGAFLITKSGERICRLLGISKFTLYNYLDEVRGITDEKK
ncbi:MAG: helix-turn-helix transcriptional regulator [Erysipelotrichaceae bacterium]